MLWEILKSSKGILVTDLYADLWANIAGGGTPVDVFVEMIGTLPLYYDGKGIDLADYRIAGNAVQNGTPSPDAPVNATGCGVRTGNLFDKSTTQNGYYIDDADGKMKRNIGYVGVLSASDYIDIANASSIFITDTSQSRWGAYYDSSKTYVSGFNGYGSKSVPSTARYVRITVPNAELDSMMLNAGSTALPYEPYGYKLDISSGGENLAWTGWAQDFVSRIGNANGASMVTDDGRECLQYNVSAGYGQYDTKYIFKTEWKENTRYSISFYGKRPTGMTAATVARLVYTDDTFENINVQAAGVGNYVRYAVVSAAGKTIKSLCAHYSSGSFIIDINTFMVNEGSTAKPYSPYNRTTTTIFLGQVETTRRIKKLVLTGEEDIAIRSGNARWYIPIADMKIPAGMGAIEWYCSHYQAIANNAAWTSYDYMISWSTADTGSSRGLRIRDINFLTGATLADFKTYLAAQYSAGTPVTVWYVLATEETAVVNEPLMNIGDYADTVSFAQAGVTIPTENGENILDMTSPVKPSVIYVKGKGIKPTGYGQLADVNGVNILDKDGRPIYVHGQ